MCYHQQHVDEQPIAYETTRVFHTEDHRLDLDKGDKITPEEFESLSFDEQGVFVPVYKDKK